MKTFEMILFGALVVLGAATTTVTGARAEKKPPTPVIAVIDVQVILRDSKAMKAVRDQIEVQRKKFQEEITAQEKKLRASNQKIEQQRAVLSPEAYAQKQRELRAQVAEVQRQVQARRRQLDQAFTEAATKFQQTLVKLVRSLAKEKGFNLVFAKAQIVHVAPAFDITAQTLKRLDKVLPTLKVNLPAK